MWGRDKQLAKESWSLGTGQRGRPVPWGALPGAETSVGGCTACGPGFEETSVGCALLPAAAQQSWLPSLPWGILAGCFWNAESVHS